MNLRWYLYKKEDRVQLIESKEELLDLMEKYDFYYTIDYTRNLNHHFIVCKKLGKSSMQDIYIFSQLFNNT